MTVRVNQCKTIRQGRVFDFTVENVTFPNGVTIDLEVIRHPGAAAVVALDNDHQVLMLRQYRHAVGDYIWEIPAGTFHDQESPIACARRELGEETGFEAQTWSSLGAVTPLAGYSDERIHLFLASELIPVEQNLDPDEFIEVHRVPLDQVNRMIIDGKIEDAKTIAALYRAREEVQQAAGQNDAVSSA